MNCIFIDLIFPQSFAVGPGIQENSVIPEFLTSFDIDCRRSGLGDLMVKIFVNDDIKVFSFKILIKQMYNFPLHDFFHLQLHDIA